MKFGGEEVKIACECTPWLKPHDIVPTNEDFNPLKIFNSGKSRKPKCHATHDKNLIKRTRGPMSIILKTVQPLTKGQIKSLNFDCRFTYLLLLECERIPKQIFAPLQSRCSRHLMITGDISCYRQFKHS